MATYTQVLSMAQARTFLVATVANSALLTVQPVLSLGTDYTLFTAANLVTSQTRNTFVVAGSALLTQLFPAQTFNFTFVGQIVYTSVVAPALGRAFLIITPQPFVWHTRASGRPHTFYDRLDAKPFVFHRRLAADIFSVGVEIQPRISMTTDATMQRTPLATSQTGIVIVMGQSALTTVQPGVTMDYTITGP